MKIFNPLVPFEIFQLLICVLRAHRTLSQASVNPHLTVLNLILRVNPSNLAIKVANGHITLNTPVLVRSLKLSSIEPSQYLDG